MKQKDIDAQTIASVKLAKAIQDKYSISQNDYADLHKAFQKIHTEHLLNETNKAINEYSAAKAKDLVLMKFTLWLKTHLEIPFKPLVDIEKYKGRL